ncbi:MAG: YceI family protein [Winogradskyella sp.]|uniref:YceI family protein n=1 Tax=Winogradskyella sp. TaxID=1883156 RepID=UPI000F3F2018|nr:YceI family protein [Winogradskyella sp.]RNC88337.1 MAG: YceI family protein [Winogradskyella sp.]
MKKRTFLIILIISNLALCHSQTSEKLNINTSTSEIKWTGEYAFYFGGHKGIIDFKEGHFLKENEVISGGEFIIDMNTIVCTDNDEIDKDSGLVNHLKDPDFFDVKKYPIAKLVITSVSYHNATQMKIFADLTIKDITLPIHFEAKVNYTKKEMTTRFKIDRTLWNITYNSKEVEGKLKDGLISDAIGFEVKLSL